MKKICYIALILLISISCNRTKIHEINQGVLNTIIIPHEGIEPQTLSIKEFVDSLVFIPIKLKQGDYIYEIDKVISQNNKLFVLDQKQLAIFVFSENGTFISKIAKQGKGPGEYPYLSDFSVQNDTVLVLNRNKVFKYSIAGSFLGEIYLKFIPANIEYSNGYYYFFRRGQTDFGDEEYYYDLIKCNSEGKVINLYFPYEKDNEMYQISTQLPFYRSQNTVHYIPGKKDVNHKVYSLSTEHPTPVYEIKRNSDKPFSIGSFYETPDILSFNIYSSPTTATMLVSKVDSTMVYFNKALSDSDFLLKGTTIELSKNSYMLTTLEPSTLGFAFNDNPTFKSTLVKAYPEFALLFEYMQSEDAHPILIKEYYKSHFKGIHPSKGVLLK